MSDTGFGCSHEGFQHLLRRAWRETVTLTRFGRARATRAVESGSGPAPLAAGYLLATTDTEPSGAAPSTNAVRGVRCFPQFGTSPYTYSWEITSHDSNVEIQSGQGSETVYVRKLASGGAGYAEFNARCTVTDSLGAQGLIDIDYDTYGASYSLFIEEAGVTNPTIHGAYGSPLTPPSGTALYTVHVDATAGQLCTFGAAFTRASGYTTADLARFFIYNGSTVVPCQLDNYVLREDDSTLLWAAVSFIVPSGYTAKTDLTFFHSATESQPAAPSWDLLTGNTVVATFSAYRPAVWGVFCAASTTNGLVLKVTISSPGLSDETYFDVVKSTDGYEDKVYNVIGRLARKINASSRYWRTTEGTLGNFGSGVNTGSSAAYGLHHIKNLSSYTSYGNGFFITQKAVPSGEEPRTFTVTIHSDTTLAANAAQLRTVRNKTTYTASLASASSIMTWLNGNICKQGIYQMRPVDGSANPLAAIRVFFLPKKSRDGEFVNEIMVLQSDMATTGVEEITYDFTLTINGSTAYSETDLWHTPRSVWAWPLVAQRIGLINKTAWNAAKLLPQIDRLSGSYTQSWNSLIVGLTNWRRGFKEYTGTGYNPYAYRLVESKIGKPLRVKNFDYGVGNAGAGPNYGWLDNWCASAFEHYNHQSIELCSAHFNSFGTAPWHWIDENGTGDHAFQPLDIMKASGKAYKLDAGVMITREVSDDGLSRPTEDCRSLRASNGGYVKASHAAFPDFLPYLITGCHRFMFGMESEAAMILRSGGVTDANLVVGQGSNTTYSADGLMHILRLANGLRGKTGVIARASWLGLIYPNARTTRRTMWVNLVKNIALNIEKQLETKTSWGTMWYEPAIDAEGAALATRTEVQFDGLTYWQLWEHDQNMVVVPILVAAGMSHLQTSLNYLARATYQFTTEPNGLMERGLVQSLPCTPLSESNGLFVTNPSGSVVNDNYTDMWTDYYSTSLEPWATQRVTLTPIAALRSAASGGAGHGSAQCAFNMVAALAWCDKTPSARRTDAQNIIAYLKADGRMDESIRQNWQANFRIQYDA